MMKNYFFILSFFLLFFVSEANAQLGISSAEGFPKEELSVYPNPVTSGKIHISSLSEKTKQVEIYDVLGKKVLDVITSSNKEINVSGLSAGIYIITIKEGKYIATRKLVIR